MVSYKFDIAMLNEDTEEWETPRTIIIEDAADRDNAVWRFMATLAKDYMPRLRATEADH